MWDLRFDSWHHKKTEKNYMYYSHLQFFKKGLQSCMLMCKRSVSIVKNFETSFQPKNVEQNVTVMLTIVLYNHQLNSLRISRPGVQRLFGVSASGSLQLKKPDSCKFLRYSASSVLHQCLLEMLECPHSWRAQRQSVWLCHSINYMQSHLS